MRISGTLPLLGALVAALPLSAAAQGEDALLERINTYRSDPPDDCAAVSAAAGPLAPEPALAGMALGEGGDLQQALRAGGYAAARVQVLSLSGPASAREAMDFLVREYCAPLLDARYSDAGVTREGRRWQVVLAQPQIAADLGSWREAGRALLEEVNAARAEARRCGDQYFESVGALRWDARLAQAARSHSSSMAEQGYFAHRGQDGSTVGRRAQSAGYKWQRIGENIAAGQGTPAKVVQGWLSSPGHCSNLMNPGFAEMGAAYATNLGSENVIYWTQVLGTPR